MYIRRESLPYPCRSDYDEFYYGDLPFYNREYYYPKDASYMQVRTSVLQDNLSYYDKKIISLEQEIEALKKEINELKGITEE